MCFTLYVLATRLTVCYTFRLVYYSLTGNYNLGCYSRINDSSTIITRSIMVLGSGAILGGCLLSWLIFPEVYMICMSPFIKSLVLMIRILGAFVGYRLNIIRVRSKLNSVGFYRRVVFMGSM